MKGPALVRSVANAKVRGTAVGQMGMLSNGLSNGLDGESLGVTFREEVAQ
jgi:hypothetical protein